MKQLFAGGAFEIEGQAFLVAVEHHEDGALLTDIRIAAAGFRFLARALDLDDFGAHVAEHHPAIGAGPRMRELQNPNAVQRSLCHATGLASCSSQLLVATGCPAE